MRNGKLSKLIKVSLLSVIGFLLMYIELPIPLFPEFLKIDISDLPGLLGAFSLGPIQGVIIQLFKNVLHGIFATKTVFVGELSNFLVGATMILVAGYVYKIKKTRKSAILGLALGTLVMSLVAGILNIYLFLPLYQKVLHLPIEAFVDMAHKINPSINNLNGFILYSIVPFNLIKGIFMLCVTMITYKRVSPILHSEKSKKEFAN